MKSDFRRRMDSMSERIQSPLRDELVRLNQINKAMNDGYHEASVRHGVNDSTFDILYSIYELGDGCLQRDICKVSYLAKQTVHSAIRKLEQDGMICMEPGKGRQMHIRLTEKGREKITQFIIPIVRCEEEALQVFDEKEVQQMLLWYERYVECLRTKLQDV